ncbi:MAG: gliding motility-associated C-terminal domain-containing protein [Saprospiraceae bacterium]|nr:gliding motility-associated C-terminal domain-containing protein [Saprospiraceae bacterium]
MTNPYLMSPRLIALFFFLFPFFLNAQTENCTNGIDDDGDGLIDCFDQDCTCTGQCEDFYYTTCNADCFYHPPCNQISLGIQWTSDAQTGTYSPLVAGDLDRDGIPEVVTTRVEASDIYILNGATGMIKHHIIGPTIYPGGTAPAIADLDNDGFGEIVLVGRDLRLRCWDHLGNVKWTSPGTVGYAQRYEYSIPAIADMDHNGLPEVVVGNQVFSGQNGALLAQGGPNVSAGEHPARRNIGFSWGASVPIDALPDNFCPDCAGLEIVAGNQVLSVNMVTGVCTPVVTAAAPFTDGYTSVVDFDRDGDLDAIVQGKKGTQNAVYCWEIESPTIMRQFNLLNNITDGASRVNVADLNGDGELEISFVGHPRLYALRNDFSLMWQRSANDPSSVTCSSVFDFCGDGSADIIYRGTTFLQVIEGATGAVKWQDDCRSDTHIENPLILDVDGDGQTEIVIECANAPGIPNNPTPGTVVCYEAVGIPGIASRKVWNQHGYHSTNINEDLSVPRYQQNPHIIGDSLKMNTFLNQYFNPTFPSPDGVLTFENVVCDRDSLEVTLEICNVGDNLMPDNTPISIYSSNPQQTLAPWAGAIPLGFALQKDSCRQFTIRIPRIANDSVYLVLNDDHSNVTPYSLANDFPITAIGECEFRNNMAVFYYAYQPDALNLGPDTSICYHTSLPLDAAGHEYVTWNWQNNTQLPTFTAPGPGTYTVTVTDVCGITQTDAITISYNPATLPDLGSDRVMCQGEKVTLLETGFDNYAWSPANILDCANCATVQAGPSATTQVILTASFADGCTNRDTVMIMVNDTFNYRIDTTICYGREVQWVNQAGSMTTINPDQEKTFFYSTQSGCDSTVTVRVIGTPVGTFQIQVDTAVCLGKSIDYLGFNLEPGDSQFYPLTALTGCDSSVTVNVLPKDTFYTTESRRICAGDSSLIFGSPITVSGIYPRLFNARNGCDSTHVVYLTVLDPIVLDIQGTPACVNEPTGAVSAMVFGNAPPFDYAWDILGETSPQVAELPAGTYNLTVTDANDCTETGSVDVEEYPAILATVTVDSVRCYGEKNGSILIESNDPTLTYSLDGGPFNGIKQYNNLEANDYVLQIQDSYGCVDTFDLNVGQPDEFYFRLPEDLTIRLGDSVAFDIQHNSAGPFQFIWNDTLFLSHPNSLQAVSTPHKSFRYDLLLLDKNGCSARDQILITVQRVFDVYVPNAVHVLPESGANGRLDISFGAAIEKINYFQLYDRWGNLVHELHNWTPNDNSRAWDGYHDGKPMTPGVLVWVMEVQLVDGTTERLKGDVTVVR